MKESNSVLMNKGKICYYISNNIVSSIVHILVYNNLVMVEVQPVTFHNICPLTDLRYGLICLGEQPIAQIDLGQQLLNMMYYRAKRLPTSFGWVAQDNVLMKRIISRWRTLSLRIRHCMWIESAGKEACTGSL